MADGLFDPHGMYRRVNREPVLLLGGGTALLMQVAHPKVAAAVAAHSAYREQPLRRLYATVEAMQKIIYGDRDTALETVGRINAIHRRVSGTLNEGTSSYPAGTPYTATDPALLMWVYATVTITTLNAYEALVRPLTSAQVAAFYNESRYLAQLFGAPEESIPLDIEAFRAYVNEMMESEELEITPTSQSVASDIVHPPIKGFPRLLDDLVRIPALALLPEQLRWRYGFTWDSRRQSTWSVASRLIRATLPFAPNLLRANKYARRAERKEATG